MSVAGEGGAPGSMWMVTSVNLDSRRLCLVQGVYIIKKWQNHSETGTILPFLVLASLAQKLLEAN